MNPFLPSADVIFNGYEVGDFFGMAQLALNLYLKSSILAIFCRMYKNILKNIFTIATKGYASIQLIL